MAIETARQRATTALRSSGYADGGGVHSDAKQDTALVKKLIGTARIKLKGGGAVPGVEPMERPDRRARGGHVKGRTVNVIVVNGKSGGDKPPMPVPVHPPMAGPPPGPGPGGPPMPPPGAMPPRPMGGPPPGMARPPGVRRGGAVAHRALGGMVPADGPETDKENNATPFSDAQDFEKGLEKARDAKGRFMGGAI